MTEKFQISKKLSALFKADILIEGYNGERAVMRLKRHAVPMFCIKRVSKNAILVRIYRKDVRKVFAFLENSCYNIKRVQPAEGYAFALKIKRSFSLFIGAAAFFLLVFASKDIVADVRVEGSGSYYETEVLSLLAEYGIKPFSFIKDKNIPLATTAVLSLPDVSFASLKKSGYVLTVNVEVSYSLAAAEERDFTSDCEGILKDLVVLSGVPVKAEGESVSVGEVLVRAVRTGADGTEQPCIVMAKAVVECSVSESGLTEEQARAKAKLFFDGEIEREEISFDGEYYVVKITYLKTIFMNMG